MLRSGWNDNREIVRDLVLDAIEAYCAERGVRIALGSDSHEVSEVGEFVPHLRVLAAAGIEPADFPRLLFTPDQTPRRRLA